jgi:PAS domain S-box-containing protein
MTTQLRRQVAAPRHRPAIGRDSRATPDVARATGERADHEAQARDGAGAETGLPPIAQVSAAVLEAVGVATYVTDAAGRITFYNDAAVRLWGRRPKLGELWCGSLRMFHPDGSPLAHEDCPMATALRQGRPVRDQEAILERPDGTRAWFRPYPTPITDRAGRVTGAVNVMIDLTELRKAEDALRATATALGASNAVKDEFLGLVSHELRTPITTILGNARLLRDRGEGINVETRESMVSDIAVESERLLGIVENLLILTKLESGVRPDPEPQVLAHVVRTTIEAFNHRYAARTVVLAAEPRHLIVDADRPYLELLLGNFLSNAHKYSPLGTTVEVVVGSGDRQAEVRVLDRGIGLEDSDPDRLFTAFYRARAAKSQSAGLGIGLAACKRVAEALGGRVWAQPRHGGGSEFGFALPLASPTEPDEAVPIA